MKKIYVVELNIFKENAICGLQKTLLENFLGNFDIWSAIGNGTWYELEKYVFRWFYFRFARFYATFNFRGDDFDSFSAC